MMSEDISRFSVDVFIDILKRNGLINKMYDTVNKADLSDAVMTALDILEEAKLITIIEKPQKSENLSDKLRSIGNLAFMTQDFAHALVLYNRALLHAPKKSESMVLAYSNRSALLFEIKAIRQCIRDIDTCFSIGCTKVIHQKLLLRKEKCQVYLVQDEFKNYLLNFAFAVDYLRFTEKRHKHIPCASADVEVVVEKGLPKVVAARNIECGKIVAIEPAFVADLHEDYQFTACYHCQKLSFNLKPCDGCFYILFCDDECEKQSMKEYHKIECQIMHIIIGITNSRYGRLPIKAALKIREMSQSWSDFVSTSTKIGSRRMEQSSINEIFDVNNKLSILNFDDKKRIVSGKIFNQSFLYAVVLMYLRDIPEYLPRSEDEKDKAMRALARIMLTLCVSFPLELDLQNAAQNHQTQSISSEPEASTGFFSFASKLPHRCEPNLFCFGLNNKLALMAAQPIKKGTELTISFIGPWCEVNYGDERAITLFMTAELKCRCRVCVEDWSSFNVKSVDLTHQQARCLRKWRQMQVNRSVVDLQTKFRETCYVFKMFQDIPHSREYYEIFREWRRTLTSFQYSATQNDYLPLPSEFRRKC